MFDFFKYIYRDINGIEEKNKKITIEKKISNMLINNKKLLIYFMGCMFILLNISLMPMFLKSNKEIVVIKSFIQMLVCLLAMIFISFKNKKINMLGRVFVGIFILLNIGEKFL